jgi:4-hydroxybenzoate polyprenyltransferase
MNSEPAVRKNGAVTDLRVENPSDSHALGVRTSSTPRALLRAMRPLQWTKNGLVFAAMIFDRKFTDASSIGLAILAAICFCAASSATYLLNDVRDAERDRIHPKKRFRPIASGALQQRTALIAAAVLSVSAVGFGALIRWEFSLVIAGYLALMIAYNTVLKQIAIIDVFAIGGGFVLRAVGGAVAIDVPISPWLYVCTMLLALFVGFGKRRQELTSLAEDATAHRESLVGYSVPLLDQFINILAAATVIAYSVYTFDAAAVPRNHAMMLTIPFVVYAIFRYLLITQKSDLGGAPETLLFADKPLLLSLIGWGFTSALIIFITK